MVWFISVSFYVVDSFLSCYVCFWFIELNNVCTQFDQQNCTNFPSKWSSIDFNSRNQFRIHYSNGQMVFLFCCFVFTLVYSFILLLFSHLVLVVLITCLFISCFFFFFLFLSINFWVDSLHIPRVTSNSYKM